MSEHSQQEERDKGNQEVLKMIRWLLRDAKDFSPKYLYYANEEAGIFLPHDKTPAADSEEHTQLRALVGEVREAIEALFPLVNLQGLYEETQEYFVTMEAPRVEMMTSCFGNGWLYFYVWDENHPGAAWWDEERDEITTENPECLAATGQTDDIIKTQWTPNPREPKKSYSRQDNG